MDLCNLETPALLVDYPKLLSNLKKMQAYFTGTGTALRPHYKTHKSVDLARLQLEYGAKGITCAKLGEAEDLAESGISDILLANQIVQPSKLSRLAYLAKKCRLTVCVDDTRNIRQLENAAAFAGSTVFCLVEYDLGMNRCGAQTSEEVIALARQIADCSHLVFEGIQAYAGFLSHENDFEKRQNTSTDIEQRLARLKNQLTARGLPPKEISGVSTGTAGFKQGGSIYTEVQPGSYVFLDAAYREMGLPFERALFILSTVISAKEDRIVLDMGRKACGIDQGPPLLCGLPRETPLYLSEEHGIAQTAHNLQPGDTVLVIPGHCCTTVNLYDKYYVVQDEKVIDVWPVTSRGRYL